MTAWICSLAVANRQESIPGKGIFAKHQEASEACKCRNSLIPHSSPSGALEGSPMSFTPCPPGTWQSPHPWEVPPATGNGLSPCPCCVQEELWCQIQPHFTLNPFKCVLKISLLQAANPPCIPNPPLLMLHLCLALMPGLLLPPSHLVHL